MDGKPLYEYARTNTPLPRPIASRKVTVHALSLVNYSEGDQHLYEFPKAKLGDKEKEELENLEKMVREGKVVVESAAAPASEGGAVEVAQTAVPDVAPDSAPGTILTSPLLVNSKTKTNLPLIFTSEPPTLARPPTFEISMTVSSGTYVRSIIHDIGIALGSSAHVVKLTRTRQGEFTLDPSTATTTAEGVVLETFPGGCVQWEVLDKALKALERKKKGDQTTEGDLPEEERDAEGWFEWEREILHRCKEV